MAFLDNRMATIKDAIAPTKCNGVLPKNKKKSNVP